MNRPADLAGPVTPPCHAEDTGRGIVERATRPREEGPAAVWLLDQAAELAAWPQ